MKRIVILILLIPLFMNFKIFAKGYGVGPNRTSERPTINEPIITDNNGYVIGPDDNSIYLTFDCGYENGYTEKILDTLKENDVKACFFITGHYLSSATNLVKRMEEEGHIVGNHTNKHRDFTKSNKEQILDDVRTLEKNYQELIGKPMSKFVRPPRGEFNEMSQKLLKDNGYTSVFWSLAYIDWYQDKYYGNCYSYNKVMSKIHNGAIILMHAVSRDNCVDLDKIVKELKRRGYVFKSIEELNKV